MADKKRTGWNGSNPIGRNIPEGYYTSAAVAEKIGRSQDTVRHWRRKKIFEPSRVEKYGEVTVYLYSEDDVKAMRKIAGEIRPGPKPGSTPKVAEKTSVPTKTPKKRKMVKRRG